MDYRLEEKPLFRIAGIKKRVSIQFEGVNKEIEKMWKSLDDTKMHDLEKLSNMEPSGIINASADFDESRINEEGKLDHYIGVATTQKVSKNWNCLEVPANS